MQTPEALALAESQLRTALPLITLVSGLAAAAGALVDRIGNEPEMIRSWALPAHCVLIGVALYWLRHPPRRASLAGALVGAYLLCVIGSLLATTGATTHLLNLGIITVGSFYFLQDRRFLIPLQLLGFSWVVAALPVMLPQPDIATPIATLVAAWGGGLAIHVGRSRVLDQLTRLEAELGARSQELRLAREALEDEVEERERVQENALATQKLESLGVMAGGVAHDFNNLLVGILGGVEIALDTKNRSPERDEALEMIRASSLTARDLCQQLLDFVGNRPVPRETTDLHEVVRDAIRLAGASLPAGLSVRADLRATEPFVDGDRTQLQQVVVNLIANAAEAMEPSAGRIGIESRLEGARFLLSVHDAGPGIDPEVLPRIFDPFFTTKFAGRGLGLSASLGIVRSHGGELRVADTGERGTRFEISLPWTAKRPARVVADARDGAPRRGRGRVLLVDDEERVLETGRRLLERLGFEVERASSGEEALARAQVDPSRFQLMLVDATMPGIDGEATIRGLRARAPGLPAILSSGHTRTVLDSMRRLAGPEVRFLAKPYRMAELARAIDDAMEKAIPSV